MEPGGACFRFFRAETITNLILLTITFSLASTSTPAPEELQITTESFQLTTTAANITEAPDDDGIAIEDIPQEPNSTTPPTAPESKEEEASAVDQQPVLVSFPDNHKNFTPSQYLGDQDFPPYYNHLSRYQQQYKNYNEQKQIYNTKPIKFEENANYYLHDPPHEKKTENVRQNRNPKPFPYAFDTEQVQDSWYTPPQNDKPAEGWYKPQTHFPVKENSYKVNDNALDGWYKHILPVGNSEVIRGHQESPVGYYAYPYSHPEKLLSDDVLHVDHHHHHVKKEEKDNPWKKVFHVLTALVPLGLLLASLTPNVIAINSTAATKTSRRRSEDVGGLPGFKEEDVVRLMKKYGVESLKEGECEDRIICELATEGGKQTAGAIERGFWFLANQTPWDIAEKAGMNDLFNAIKAGKCDIFKCQQNIKPSRGAKKLLKKHKTAK